MSVLIKKTPENAQILLPCKDTKRNMPPRTRVSLDPDFILLTSKTVRNKFLWFIIYLIHGLWL